ncbi:Mbov_0395 family pilin-like conjugal transfer protein [Mycoplasmopsis agassizii]|uniref:Uncharacterized protein n=1 Tax=Mycoplasmopsis agassizii TaxID=33922 RepID=A0ABX4H638_9BACT|nr:pilin [Mycoplasmopsis agassizii]PAF55368.1 hypothetical protein CJF60_01610 [Mycoplasmopsis agassizii]SMC20964.1 hypothetical protein SAMN02745179_01049 [Mycoplasmopsis agassizii]
MINNIYQFLSNIILSTDARGKLKEGLEEVSKESLKYASIFFGAVAGLVAVVLIVAGIYYGVMLGTSTDAEKRQKWIKNIKWLLVSFVAILIIWGLASLIIGAVNGVFSQEIKVKSLIFDNHLWVF